METNISTFKTHRNLDFEKYFKNLEREQLELAAIKGQQDGLANKPSSLRNYKIQVFAGFASVFQKAVDYNYFLHQPISNMAITTEFRNSELEATGILEKEKNLIERKILVLKNELIDLKSSTNVISSKLKLLIAVLFGLSEGVLLFSVLQGASYPLLARYLLSFVIILASSIGLTVGANYIAKATEKRDKQKRLYLILGLAFVFASGLGLWRAIIYGDTTTINAQIGLTNSTHTDSIFSSIPFILISFISFIVALSFEIKYWLSDAEKLQLTKYDQKSIELKKAKQDLEDLENKIKEAKTAIRFQSENTLRQQEYAYVNEQRLITLGRQIINCYESANIEFRRDNTCPAYFGDSTALELKLYFANLFNNLKHQK